VGKRRRQSRTYGIPAQAANRKKANTQFYASILAAEKVHFGFLRALFVFA